MNRMESRNRKRTPNKKHEIERERKEAKNYKPADKNKSRTNYLSKKEIKKKNLSTFRGIYTARLQTLSRVDSSYLDCW